MSFSTLLTTDGQALIASAIAGASTLTLSHMAVGDGNGAPVTPSTGMTTLVNEVHRAALNRIYRDTSDNALVYAELVIPSSIGGFTVREAGIFADDGTLVAVANLASTYKPNAAEGSASEMVVRMVLNLGASASVNLTISGSVVTATQDWANAAFLKQAENLADLPDKAAARANLGVVLAVMQFLYPVGETLVTSRSGSPSEWLGFGTWERVASGAALAGVDPNNAAKDAAGKTFGANSRILGINHLPPHAHAVASQTVPTSPDGAHSHPIDPPACTTTSNGSHAHVTPFQSGYGTDFYGFTTQANNPPNQYGWNAATDGVIADGKFANTSTVQDHTHSVDIPQFNSGASGAHAHSVSIPAQNTGNTGAGDALDTTPASYAVHVWKRTA